jgi:hypothetical protein
VVRVAIAQDSLAPIGQYLTARRNGLTSGLPGVGNGLVPARLAAWRLVIKRIRLLGRQTVRELAHNFHNFQCNDIARSAGGTFEQIPHRGADLRLGVIGTRGTRAGRSARPICFPTLELWEAK